MQNRQFIGQKDITELPNRWIIKKISDFCEVRTCGTPSMQHPEYFGGDIRWIRSGDIHKKRIYDVEGRITKQGNVISYKRISLN